MTTTRRRLKIEFLPGDSKISSKFLKILRILILVIIYIILVYIVYKRTGPQGLGEKVTPG